MHRSRNFRRRLEIVKQRVTSGEAEQAVQDKYIEDPRVIESARRAGAQNCRYVAAEGDLATGMPGLSLYRQSTPTACASAAYDPRLVVFVQGQKRINVGSRHRTYAMARLPAYHCRLPVVSQVVAATAEEPMLGLMLKLEMPAVREILAPEEFQLREESADARAMAVGVTSVELLDACSRLVYLLDAPQDIPFFSGLIQREIVFRLFAVRRENTFAPSPRWASRVIGLQRRWSGCE